MKFQLGFSTIFHSFFSEALTSIFNRSLSIGIMQSCLKIASVIPIPKCPNPKVTSEFRPISLLPVLSKVLERLVSRKLILPCIRPILNRDQFAYIPGSSTGTTTVLTRSRQRLLFYAMSK